MSLFCRPSRMQFLLPLARTLLLLVVGMAFLLGTLDDANAATRKKKKMAAQIPDRYASIVIDAETGTVLSSASPDRRLHPASLTKMMTLLLTFEALAENRVRLNDYIVVSSRAANVSPSKLGVAAGGRVRVDDAVRAVTVKSANDIAIALAEALAGSESRFVMKMNDRARSLGMNNTRFANASGLPNASQVSSARDMAILARHIIRNYPNYYRYFGLRSFAYAGRVHPNHNKLMLTYAGMDGMKTGYIDASGYNLVASAVRGNYRLIGVVFGGRTAKSRNDHMADLLDRGFDSVKKRGVAPKVDVAKLSVYPPVSPFAGSRSGDTGSQESGQGDADVLTPMPSEVARRSPSYPARKPVLNSPAGLTLYTGDDDSDDNGVPPQQVAALTAETPTTPDGKIVVMPPRSWVVQIGAYQNRDSTDRALYDAVRLLPSDLSHATPVVAPLKTVANGWLFRARLGNLDEDQAKRVCTYFRGCLLIAPERD